MRESDIPSLDERYNTTVQEYVEIIRDLAQEHSVARVKEIANLRGVTRSSVSTALGGLKDLGLIDHEHYGYVALTEDGAKLGEMLTRRHAILHQFLHDVLELPDNIADEEACRLEHAMSPAALNALLRFVGRYQPESAAKEGT